MNNIKILMIYSYLMISSIGLVFGLTYSLELSSEMVHIGDEVEAYLYVENDAPFNANDSVVISLDKSADEGIDGFVLYLSLKPWEKKRLTVYGHEITKEDYDGVVHISVLSENSGITLTKSFEIVGNKRLLIVSTRPCINSICGLTTAVINDNLSFEINVPSDVFVEIFVTDPTGKKSLVKKNNLLVLSKPGEYLVHSKILPDNYDPYEERYSIKVLSDAPKLSKLSLCSIDGICSGEETPDNCPADCMENPFVDEVSEKGVDIDDSGSGPMMDRPQNFTGKSKPAISEDDSGTSPLLKTFLILGFMAALLLLLMVIIGHHRSEG